MLANEIFQVSMICKERIGVSFENHHYIFFMLSKKACEFIDFLNHDSRIANRLACEAARVIIH